MKRNLFYFTFWKKWQSHCQLICESSFSPNQPFLEKKLWTYGINICTALYTVNHFILIVKLVCILWLSLCSNHWMTIYHPQKSLTRNLPHSGWYPLEWIWYEDTAMKAQCLKYFSCSLKYFTWAFLAKM